MLSKSINAWGLILAGGEGCRLKRFLKTEYDTDSPKQYCAMLGTRSMLRHTIDRARMILLDSRILTVITKHHMPYAEKDLYDRPKGTVIVQPESRDTGPGILLPLLHIYRSDPRALVVIFPSDHFIHSEERFMGYVRAALYFTNAFPGYINLLGIPARGTEKGYGWIEPGRILGSRFGMDLYRVNGFLEKPALNTLSRISCHNYLWNTFTLVGRISTFLNLVQLRMPMVYNSMQRIVNVLGTADEERTTGEVYRMLPPVNFSHYILERSVEHLSVIPVRDVYWSGWGEESRVRLDLSMLRSAPGLKPRIAEMSQ